MLKWLRSPLVFLVLLLPAAAYGHAGHGNEFQAPTAGAGPRAVEVDATTQEQLGLRLETVQPRPMTAILEVTGELVALPDQQAVVTMPVRGTLLRLLVQSGDRVRVGQPLAIVASPELAELRTSALDRQSEALMSVRAAEADLHFAQQNLQQQQQIAAATLREAQVKVQVAQERFDRDRELLRAGAIPRRAFLATEEELAAAQAQLAQAQSQLPLAEAHAQLQRAQAQVAVARDRLRLSQQTYRTRLQQLGTTANADGTVTITAPIAGTVVEQRITPGEASEDAGKPLLKIVNGDRLQVVAYLTEAQRAQVAVGQALNITMTGLPNRVFRSRIELIDSVVDPATQRVAVRASLANPSQELKPGSFATVQIIDDRQTRNALMIPQTAIVEPVDQPPLVFVQNGTAFQAVEVTLGQRVGDQVEVITGLYEGDRIVTQGAMQLYAQSLRGDASTATSDTKPETDAPPWIGLGVAAGAIALFWAGVGWQSYRTRRLHAAAHAEPSQSATPTKVNP